MLALCVVIVLALVVGVTVRCLQVRDDRDAAVASFNAACLALHDQNITLDKAMASLQDAIDAGGHLCDKAVLRDAHNSLADAKDAKQVEPELPRKTADIIDATERMLPTVDYDDILNEMTRCQAALEASIAQDKQDAVASASVF